MVSLCCGSRTLISLGFGRARKKRSCEISSGWVWIGMRGRMLAERSDRTGNRIGSRATRKYWRGSRRTRVLAPEKTFLRRFRMRQVPHMGSRFVIRAGARVEPRTQIDQLQFGFGFHLASIASTISFILEFARMFRPASVISWFGVAMARSRTIWRS